MNKIVGILITIVLLALTLLSGWGWNTLLNRNPPSGGWVGLLTMVLAFCTILMGILTSILE
jgi:hypothetical protein